MIDKAIIIASEALGFLRTQFPEDDTKYEEALAQFKITMGHLQWMDTEMRNVEHAQKTASVNGPCPCPKCDEDAGADRDHRDECLRNAVLADISPPKMGLVAAAEEVETKGNPNGVLEVVYDKEGGVDSDTLLYA
jgi:hypothetical protein